MSCTFSLYFTGNTNHEGVHVDVACGASVEALFDNAKRHSVPVSIVVNSAGILHPMADIVDMSEETFDKVINVNLKASPFSYLFHYTEK